MNKLEITRVELEQYHTVMVALENLISNEEIRETEIFEDYQEIINKLDNVLSN